MTGEPPDVLISVVNLEVGFASSSHFTQLFRRPVSFVPSTFRQANKGETSSKSCPGEA